MPYDRTMADNDTVRTTVTLDATQLTEAQQLTGIFERSALLREALKALIARENALRLIALGGTDPDAEAPPRRRFG